jgi:hypothetical protein
LRGVVEWDEQLTGLDRQAGPQSVRVRAHLVEAEFPASAEFEREPTVTVAEVAHELGRAAVVDREKVGKRVAHQVGELAALLGDAARAHEVLFSTRVLKKTGLRF